MNLIIQISIIVLLIFIIIKVIKFFGGVGKVLHAIYSKIIAPLKKIALWEYRMFRVIIINLLYPKNHIYNTLQNKDFIGVKYEIDLPEIKKNPLFRSILVLGLQFFIIRFLVYGDYAIKSISNIRTSFENYLIMNYNELKLAIISIIFGLLLGYVVYQIKRNKVKASSNIFLESTLGSIAEPVKQEMLSNNQIIALLSTNKYESIEKIYNSLKSKEISYPLLLRYFNELQNNKDHKKYDAFVELLSFLYNNRIVKSVLVGIDQGKSSIFQHSLNVTEFALSLFSNDNLQKHEVKLKSKLVFSGLAHEIGKVRSYNENKKSYQGFEKYSGYLLGQMFYFTQVGEELRDDVLHLVNNPDKSYEDDSEDIIIVNHMLNTAKNEALKIEESVFSEGELLAFYRVIFYKSLADSENLKKYAIQIDNYIYISVEDLVTNLLKSSGQLLATDTDSNSQVLSNINKLFKKDKLLVKEFENKKNNINEVKFYDVTTNKQVFYYFECFILNVKSIGIDKIALEKSNQLIAREVINLQSPSSTTAQNILLNEKSNETSTENFQLQESKNESQYKKITLSQLEDMFLEVLRNDGFIVDKIQFETKNFVRSAVEGMDFEAGAYKAFIRGVPSLLHTVFKSPGKNDDNNILRTNTYVPKGYSYGALIKEFNSIQQDKNINIEKLNEKLVPKTKDLLPDRSNKLFELLLTNKERIHRAFENKCYHDNIFTVWVNNLASSNTNGYYQLKIVNDKLVESKGANLVKDPLNYIIISEEKNLSELSQVMLVKNLADGLFLYSNLQIPVIIYFNLFTFINKLKYINPDLEYIIAASLDGFEKQIALAQEIKCKVINPLGIFEAQTKNFILNYLEEGSSLNYYLCAAPYGDSYINYINEVKEQIILTAEESIENANGTIGFYKEEFRSSE